MILDSLSHCQLYVPMHRLFGKAFKFLSSAESYALADGKYELEGESLFAIVQRGEGRGRSASPLEYHRRYIDIQFIVSEMEEMGWRNLADCKIADSPFDTNRDVGFFADDPQTWVEVQAGQFAIFYPSDAHAPLAHFGPFHKIVMKVQVH